MMKRLIPVLLCVAVGCAQDEEGVMPVLDHQGDLVGTYDAVSGSVDLADAPAEASSVVGPVGAEVELVDGFATLYALLPGDDVSVLDADGDLVEVLWIEDPELIDGLSEDDAETRLGGCHFWK